MPPAIVVTASRIEQTPVIARTELDRDAIDALQPATLEDVLDGTPGVRAVSTGGIGGGTLLTVRGGEPNFTLVTLEGIKLNNPTNSRGGAFDLGLIDPALIERINVVRGPGSAIHGSDALSGLVALQLRRPGGDGTRLGLSAQGSSAGEAGGNLRGELGWRGGGLIASAGAYDSGTLSEGSDLKRQQGLVLLEQRAGSFTLRGFALHARSRRATFPEDSGGPALAVIRTRERSELTLDAASLALRGDSAAPVRPNLQLSWSRQHEDVASPAIAPGVFGGVPATTSDSSFRRFEAVADAGFTLGRFDATFGGAVLDEDGTSRGTLDFGIKLPTGFALKRTTVSAFAEAAWHPASALTLSLAGRVDAVGHGPVSTTGRAALSWRSAPQGPTLTAAWGEGYKLPSFFALGHPLVGNPALLPERSTNAEFGLAVPLGSAGEIALTLFRNRFHDLVDFDPAQFRFVNRGEVTVRGFELAADWQMLPSLRLSGALTHLDLASATPLRNRPRWQGRLRLHWQLREAVALSAALRGNSAYNDASIPSGAVIADGHLNADLAVQAQITPALRLNLALRNATGAAYAEAVGFPAPGRVLRVELAAEF